MYKIVSFFLSQGATSITTLLGMGHKGATLTNPIEGFQLKVAVDDVFSDLPQISGSAYNTAHSLTELGCQLTFVGTKPETLIDSKSVQDSFCMESARLRRVPTGDGTSLEAGIPLKNELKMTIVKVSVKGKEKVFGLMFRAGTEKSVSRTYYEAYVKACIVEHLGVLSVGSVVPVDHDIVRGTVNPATFLQKFPDGQLILDQSLLTGSEVVYTNLGTNPTQSTVGIATKSLLSIPSIWGANFCTVEGVDKKNPYASALIYMKDSEGRLPSEDSPRWDALKFWPTISREELSFYHLVQQSSLKAVDLLVERLKNSSAVSLCKQSMVLMVSDNPELRIPLLSKLAKFGLLTVPLSTGAKRNPEVVLGKILNLNASSWNLSGEKFLELIMSAIRNNHTPTLEILLDFKSPSGRLLIQDMPEITRLLLDPTPLTVRQFKAFSSRASFEQRLAAITGFAESLKSSPTGYYKGDIKTEALLVLISTFSPKNWRENPDLQTVVLALELTPLELGVLSGTVDKDSFFLQMQEFEPTSQLSKKGIFPDGLCILTNQVDLVNFSSLFKHEQEYLDMPFYTCSKVLSKLMSHFEGALSYSDEIVLFDNIAMMGMAQNYESDEGVSILKSCLKAVMRYRDFSYVADAIIGDFRFLLPLEQLLEIDFNARKLLILLQQKLQDTTHITSKIRCDQILSR